MNFLIKRAAFFTLLVTTFFACEEPGEIGLDIKNPGQSFGVLYTDTVDVPTSTVLVDSVRTSSSGYLMAGQYTDPQFGTIVAKSFFQIYPYSNDTLFLGDTPTPDSVVLFLHESFSYGDTTQMQEISVHLLQDSVQDKSHYSTELIPYELNTIGIGELRSTPKKSDDTLKIKLDSSVGITLANLNGKSEQAFLDSFFGFAILPGATDNASVINFNALISSGSRVRLYYKNAASASQRVYDFAIDPRYAFNNLEATNKNGTPLANLQTPNQPIAASSTEQETFVQGGVGIMTKIDFSELLKLANNKTIRLNQAVLTIQPVLSKTGTYTTLPSQLVLYRASSSGNLLRNSNGVYIPVENISTSGNPTIIYDSANRYYKFDVTQYLQQVLNNSQSAAPAVYLSVPSFSLNEYYRPSNSQAPDYVAAPSSLESSVSRLVLGSQQHPVNALKLEVYYTEIKQ